MQTAAPPAAPGVKSPSPANVSPALWDRHAKIAYRFARNARHDMVNIQCSLQLIEVVEKIRGVAGDEGLPPELQPQAVKEKVNIALKQLVSVANDMVLMSQAGSAASYYDCRHETVQQLLQEAIISRLGEESSPPAGLQSPDCAARRTVVLGDELSCAIATFYFQWTPWCHDHGKAAGARIEFNDDSFTLLIPTDDAEPVASFARQLADMPNDQALPPSGDSLSVSTCELALWLARFIVLIHGGMVRVDPNDPHLMLRVSLPTTR